MPNISTLATSYQITLEESKTGKVDSSDWERYTIPVDFNVSTVTSIYSTATGTGGTEYLTEGSNIVWVGNQIVLPAGLIADDTDMWITYTTEPLLLAAGTPIGFGKSALAVAPTILSAIISSSDTGTDYEISGLTTGQTLAAEIRFVPPLTNVVITQIEVVTNGSNISIGIYEGAETTGDVLNLKFQKAGITVGEYNSSTEFPNLRVVILDDAWRLGIVDTGADATPATTQVTVRGYPYI